jgi:hypothetical protein
MRKLNYEKLMSVVPTEYDRMINSIGQEIVFYEHPIRGDEEFVIAVCHELKIAAYTDFFDIYDMIADHKGYEPKFINNELILG